MTRQEVAMIDTEGLDAREIAAELRQVDVHVEAVVTLDGLRSINVPAREAEGVVVASAFDLLNALDAEGLLARDIIAAVVG